MLFYSCRRKQIVKDTKKMTDTLLEVLKKGIKKQFEACYSYIAIDYQSEKCPENISKILYNQIGALVFCNEELDKLFEYLNLLDCLIDCIS